MAKRNNFTGDLFAPGESVVPNTVVPVEQAAPDLAENTHNKHKVSVNTPLIKRRITTKKEETKSKRLNLLVRPGVLKEFAKIAYMQQTSVNDLINRLISGYNEKESATIRQFDRMFKDKA